MKHIKIVLSLMILSVLIIIPKYKAIQLPPTEVVTRYCPYGQVSNITYAEGSYSGCLNINRQTAYTLISNKYDVDANTAYDISGTFLAPYRTYGTYNITLNNVSCFITSNIYEADNVQSGRSLYSYFCNNVKPGSDKRINMVLSYDSVSVGVMVNSLYVSNGLNFEEHFSSNETSVVNAVNDMKEQEKQQHEQEMNYNENNIEQPNQDDYDNYNQNEETLFDMTEDTDTSVIQIALDIITTTWIWTTMTTLLQTHTLVFSMIISILSIGIIKHALGR